jgi:hypothetical protein
MPTFNTSAVEQLRVRFEVSNLNSLRYEEILGVFGTKVVRNQNPETNSGRKARIKNSRRKTKK